MNTKLDQLIYGMTNIIPVHSNNPESILRNIELVRSGSSIDGFIFRPSFADSEKLKDYTNEDWLAILAQYSITYSWSQQFADVTGFDAQAVLDNYFKNLGRQSTMFTGDITFSVQPAIDVYRSVAKSILTSKIVLRQHQIEILELLPIDIIEEVYSAHESPIIETQIRFAGRLIEAGKADTVFTDANITLRLVCALYRSNGEPYIGPLTKPALAQINVKLPTSVRKAVVRSMNYWTRINDSFKTNNCFWKRLFKQLKWTSDSRMPTAYCDHKALLYSVIRTNNSNIQICRSKGLLAEAFKHELSNPGQMLRSLFSYLRYPKDTLYASKSTPVTGVHKYFNRPRAYTIVESDISDMLDSDQFLKALLKCSPKLLWQVLGMINEDKWYEPMSSRGCNNVTVQYNRSLPALDKAMAAKAKHAIELAIKAVKQRDNASIGKVYLDPACSNYKLQFSGRDDTSISLSGEYLTPGSTFDLSNIDMSNSLIRLGIAWRGDKSTDLDLSAICDNGQICHYGNPTLIDNDRHPLLSPYDIIMTSSGDITSCGTDVFSVECIDVDLSVLAKSSITRFYSMYNTYSGSVTANLEAFFFFNIIDAKDRILNARKVKIKLDEMQYAIRIRSKEKAALGFMYDKSINFIEILNMDVPKVDAYRNAVTESDKMDAILSARPTTIDLFTAVSNAIDPSQFVDNPEDADICISPDISVANENLLHPGRDTTKLQEIVF